MPDYPSNISRAQFALIQRRRQLFVGLTCKLFARMLFQLTTDV